MDEIKAYFERGKQYFEDLFRKISKSQTITRMTDRERILVAVAAVAVILTILIFGIFAPLLDRIDDNRSKTALYQKKLVQMYQLKNEYDQLKEQMKSQEKNFSQDDKFKLTTYIEQSASDLGIKVESISDIDSPPTADSYQEDSYQIKFERITYPQLLELLEAIDTAPQHISVKRMQVRTRFDNQEFLNISLIISVYRLV